MKVMNTETKKIGKVIDVDEINFTVIINGNIETWNGNKVIQVKTTPNRETIVDAYNQAKKDFSFLEISTLYKHLKGINMEDLKSFIVSEAQKGRAIMSRGDWSLTSEEVHEGVIEIDGYKYLLVKFI